MRYYFILGKNPTLSLAEIFSVFELQGIKWRIISLVPEVLIVDLKTALSESFLRQLGGTIKFGVVVKDSVRFSVADINEIIADQAAGLGNKKFYFGFSLYKLGSGINLQKTSREIKGVAMEIKKQLKLGGVQSRWVTSKEKALSSVVVKTNKLLDQGLEVVVLVDKNKIYLGKTLAVQEFQEYSSRDYGRPGRDIKSGMLPPKLAKAMINLAQVKEGDKILDPFCGSGTILQEALLLGYQNVIGSDVSERAIDDSRRNLEWLRRNQPACRQEREPALRLNSGQRIRNYEIFQLDVSKLSDKISSQSIDAIVTEPYLGPPLKGSETKERLEKIIDELSDLYLKAFAEFKKILKPGGRVVMIWPVFKIKNAEFRIQDSATEQLKSFGFISIDPLPRDLQSNSVIKISERGSIIYSRPDQKVLREVLKFDLRS